MGTTPLEAFMMNRPKQTQITLGSAVTRRRRPTSMIFAGLAVLLLSGCCGPWQICDPFYPPHHHHHNHW